VKGIKTKKKLKHQPFHCELHIILKDEIERKKLMTKKKSESAELTRQIRLTRQT